MMNSTTLQEQTPSPFHAGEQALQSRAGKRAAMEQFGRRVIRDYLPEQHREFFAQLPFIVVGSVDADASPWASIVVGRPGFISSASVTTLEVSTRIFPGDPLTQALHRDAQLGMLGIELASRRRNRVNAQVHEVTATGFSVRVNQSFGNCPQYIQARSIRWNAEPQKGAQPVSRLTTLSAADRKLISAADTFFVSSYVQTQSRPEVEGVDVSHRGGRPGFVRVTGDTLTIPDYIGNFHFNTLGNFLLNPKAGLTFVDFATGDLLMLSGSVRLLAEDAPSVAAFAGAERAWQFVVEQGVRLARVLPFTWGAHQPSPNTELTGNWEQAAATLAAEAKRNQWRPHVVSRIEEESSTIRSIYLRPADGGALASYAAGQFLPVRLGRGDSSPDSSVAKTETAVRTYTVSVAPGRDEYRISVKREPYGEVSQVLHERLQVGDVIEARAPRGDFVIDAGERRPAVLIGAGVGITPMIAMAEHLVNEAIRVRHQRSLTVLHFAHDVKQRAFTDEFRALTARAEAAGRASMQYRSFVARGEHDLVAAGQVHGIGRLSLELLRTHLALDDYDFFVCGPSGFMQTTYDALRALGVRNARILAESFGPAALIRTVDDDGALSSAAVTAPVAEADSAVIRFTAAGFEQRWNSGDDTLLEVAEAHGITPEFGCRNGVCGSCSTKLVSGAVSYRAQPAAMPAPDEVLLCCAVPAQGADVVEIDL